jgi:hypothetical protein
MRVEQPSGKRGSLKWIQRAVNEQWVSLNQPILERTGDGGPIAWCSPLAADGFAEYRDSAFLNLVGQVSLAPALQDFWPARGPQWDALGRTSRGYVLLVEAKAHVAEMCSPGTAAGAKSRFRIEATLFEVARQVGARPRHAPWSDNFYQLANRFAHLHFLRANGVPAWLVLVNFLGDSDMGGPAASETWDAAYEVAFHAMGLPRRHALSAFVIHVYPTVPGESA